MSVQDFYSAVFAAEVFNTVISNTDRRKKEQKTSNAEIVELTQNLFQQSCTGVMPKEEQDHLSYIGFVADGCLPFDEMSDILVNAAEALVPVQLDPGNGCVPYVYNFIMDPCHKYSYSTGWKKVPGYGESADLFPEKEGFRPWFGVFSDALGISLFFYYPSNPSGIIEIPYYGVDLGGFKIYWRHGIPGLSKIMQVIYFEWLVRSYSHGLSVET